MRLAVRGGGGEDLLSTHVKKEVICNDVNYEIIAFNNSKAPYIIAPTASNDPYQVEKVDLKKRQSTKSLLELGH